MKSNENLIIQIISYNELIIETIEEAIPNINYDTSSLQEKLSIALFLSIFEIANSINILLKSRAHITIPSLIRNMLEAYVDLKNLLKDSDYKSVIYSSYLKEQKRFLENNVDHNKIYSKMLIDVKELLKNINCKNRGTSFASRFKEAGLQKIYISIYNKLCRETHNNINCLIERYFTIEEGRETLKYMREKGIRKICFLVQASNKLLYSSFVELLKFYDIKQSIAYTKIKELNKQYDEEFIKLLT